MLRAVRLRAASIVAVAVSAACLARQPPRVPQAPGPLLGVYRGWLSEEGEATRRFRLLLFAQMPDRLHAELLGPLGGPRVLVDGGNGRLAVTWVQERVCYAGRDPERTLERMIGVPVRLDELVRALLVGEPPDGGAELMRAPAAPGLPRRFELRAGARRLRLERQERRPIGASVTGLGSGSPPEGIDCRPLEALAEDAPAIFDRAPEPMH